LHLKLTRITDNFQPCQSLFVAPCSHVWHYKCIRPILNDHRTWPQFLCPNCRAVADLEADVDDPYDYEEQGDEEADDSSESNGTEKATLSTGGVVSNGMHAGTGATHLANSVSGHQDPDHDTIEDREDLVTRVATADNRHSADEFEPSASLLSRRKVSSNSMLQRGIKATQPMPTAGGTSPRSSNSGTEQDGDITHSAEPSSTARCNAYCGRNTKSRRPDDAEERCGTICLRRQCGESFGQESCRESCRSRNGESRNQYLRLGILACLR